MKSLVLKPKEERRVEQGHLWVFSNEIERVEEGLKPGDLVEVKTHRGTSLGIAFYHPHSLIAARLIGSVEQLARDGTLDRDFFVDRIARAAALRERLFSADTCYRLVHGESDFLPGLIVDRFAEVFSVQTVTSGMDQRLELICDALEHLFKPAAIIERNDSVLRRYEELEKRISVLRGNNPGTVEILENQVRYRVRLLEGQKTGFFLDQKLNRRAAARYSAGQRVLDCFCNSGGFALNTALAGAREAVGVDSAAAAIAEAQENAHLNQLTEKSGFERADVFEFLAEKSRRGERFGVVILDPPAFARSKKDVAAAKRAYRRLNELALSVVEDGGFLITASCSFHIFEDVFYDLVREAARRTRRQIRLLERRYQSPDHPVLPSMPETQYLKLGIFQIV
ncbi:MAG: class I SAM-dependent rRNA methyltransferase [Acidobacteria bacterium]|nr:class I SAM-dependent rRNA methyltransferase [Acidobacteriota bacterium]